MQPDLFGDAPKFEDSVEILLSNLTSDFSSKVIRLQYILELDRLYHMDGIGIPGGSTTSKCYIESRHSFVMGNFVGAILLAQAFIENTLGAAIRMQELSKSVREGLDDEEPLDKARLDHLMVLCVKMEIIDQENCALINKLRKLRNSITHYRDFLDSERADRRSMNDGRHPDLHFYEDARFAMSTLSRIAAKTCWALSGGGATRERNS